MNELIERELRLLRIYLLFLFTAGFFLMYVWYLWSDGGMTEIGPTYSVHEARPWIWKGRKITAQLGDANQWKLNVKQAGSCLVPAFFVSRAMPVNEDVSHEDVSNDRFFVLVSL